MLNLISKDLINRVSSEAELPTSSVTQFEFPSYTNICIGCINILRTIRNGVKETYMSLPENMSKDYINAWNKDVGRILIKDLKNNKDELYFELHTSTHNVLLRKILDDEYDVMKESGFTHVTIGDFVYMIVKEIPVGGVYSKINSTNGEELLNNQSNASNSTEVEEDEQQEEVLESLSLF